MTVSYAPVSPFSLQEAPAEADPFRLLGPGEMICLKTHLMPDPPFYFGNRIVGKLGGLIKEGNPDRVYLVTSQVLLNRHGVALQKSFSASGLNVSVITIDDTETRTNFLTLEHLCETLVGKNISKGSLLVGFGSGCLINIVGLASAMIFPGIRYVEIPTTLRGIADSGLRDNQAVKGRWGKNSFDAHCGPLFCFGDTQFLLGEPVADHFDAKLQKDLKACTEQDLTELALEIISKRGWEMPQ